MNIYSPTFTFHFKHGVPIYKETQEPGRKGEGCLGITLCEEAEDEKDNKVGLACGLAPLGGAGDTDVQSR